MAPTTGSCLCGAIKISFDAEPDFMAICHCLKCQKSTGSAFSTNLIVDDKTFKVKGPIKRFTSMQSVSGKATYGHFCPDCGSLMYGLGDTLVNKVSVKTGVLEGGALNKFKPTMELNAVSRAEWLAQQQDMTVFQAMPEGPPPSDTKSNDG